ncbi:hypothetical protein [Cohnella silvisoli]|uniref:RNA polymerase subunit sigma n=1 Tax=Cohnella silvisoli TaxID=2873699 RepID=A0ABV1KVH4_9BACL|nr:hypothetical protein [Cohnella silvisoli]MCD9023389.1 hypothetical protein [Cohnella silvisoli]
MSYKSIDFQASLPRTAEMSPLQHHQQQRPATEQSLLGQQAMKTAEQQAKRSVKTESTSNGTISERQPRNRNKASTSSKKQDNEQVQEESHVSEHPYKGKHIDFVG